MATHRFTMDDIQKLLANKRVVVIGDSVQRSVYKDLVCLLKANQLLKIEDLKKKGEESFEGDELLEGGSKAGLKTVNYKEVRKFTKGSTVIMYYFVTRCFGEYMKSIIATFENEPPDVVIMNSCLWDLCRYGKNANAEFRTNVDELLEAMGLVVPYDSKRMFIWNATLPVVDSAIVSACVLFNVPQAFKPENRNVRAGNCYVRDQMVDYGEHFTFLDLYGIFNAHLGNRIQDGIHWNDFAHRKITCLLLAEISRHWNVELPAQENVLPVRMAIRPSLTSTPFIGGRHSLGFLPNHARSPYERPSPSHLRSPYQRPSPRPIAHNYGTPPWQGSPLSSPYSAGPRPHMIRQGLIGPRQCIPEPRRIRIEHIARPQSPYMPARPSFRPILQRPVGVRPWSVGVGPWHRGTSSMNMYNGFNQIKMEFNFNSAFNQFLNNTLTAAVGKRRWEEDEYSIGGYKRPRKFM